MIFNAKGKMMNIIKIKQLGRAALASVCAMIGIAASAGDIAFSVPYEDWRTPIQIAGKHVAETFYEPVSVFTTNDVLEISFGFTGATAVPPVKFSVIDADHRTILDWTEPGRSSAILCDPDHYWSGHWPCDVLKLFAPGDYELVAELDPANTLNEPVSARTNNVTVFRFAIRDEAVVPEMVFTGPDWSALNLKAGNDFAQAPFAALRQVVDNAMTAVKPSIQFGPYVPMDGKAVSSRKKPLDLVFLVDISGSMGGCIRGLLNNIGNFIETLMKGDGVNEPIDDLRVKIVGFRDYKYSWDRNDLGWFDEGEFSSNLSVLKAKLNSFSASGGGGNGGETSFDALWYVAKDKTSDRLRSPTACVNTASPFRPKEEAARAVILFSDEPPHDPLTALGCSGLTVKDVVKAVEEAGINLTVVSTMLTGYSGNYGVVRYQQLADTNAYATAAKNSEYIRTSSLSTFTQNADTLRALAQSVSAKVDTIVVEPMLSVQTLEAGTLSFKWKNDSTAGTNNLFRFECRRHGSKTVVSSLSCDAGSNGWQSVELKLEEGVHDLEWTYRKIGYDGDVTDCGIITDVQWEKCATQLKVSPSETWFEPEGGVSEIIQVSCNTSWSAFVDSSCASWVSVNASASGNGDGQFTFTVKENPNHDNKRDGFITVRAESGGDKVVTVERQVRIHQKESPYKENGKVQILDVGVKPRWPWNTMVDIDFRVLTPKKSGTPVTVSLIGWDRQGEGLGFDGIDDSLRKECPKYNSVIRKECRGFGDTQNDIRYVLSAKDYVFTCYSSGVYRVTWDMNGWGKPTVGLNRLWGENNLFHTPKFAVILSGEYETSSHSLTSDPVRVDMRVGSLANCGGTVISGQEKIGHPDGAIDPFLWDSGMVNDGLVTINSQYPENHVTDDMKDKKFSVLNDIDVEGGELLEDTVWTAGRVHLVRDNVFMAPGKTLTIEDGAVVKFCRGTKIFVQYDTKKWGDASWGLAIKGAYLVEACDDSVGGDTLFDGNANSEHGLAINYTGLFYDTIFPENKSDFQSDLAGRPNYGICGLSLMVATSVTNKVGSGANSSGDATYAEKWKRAYSRFQLIGNLPRPVEEGEAFLGWFFDNSWGSTYGELIAAGDMIEDAWVPVPKKGDWIVDPSPGSNNKQLMNIYARSDAPANYTDIFWPTANGGNAEITLSFVQTNYDGDVHVPTVTMVKVDQVEIPAANYDVRYANPDSKDVGVYTLSIDWKWDYTNSPTATYAILPGRAEDAVVTFNPSNYVYNGSKFSKPEVNVSVKGQPLDASEYAVTWSDGDWTSVGTYRATVEFGGNYTGTTTADFRIEENPDLQVVLYENGADADVRVKAMQGKGLDPRILYVSGSTDDGNDGVPTRAILQMLQGEPEIRNYVISNFVCRYEDYATGGSNTCMKYAKDFTGDKLPFLGVTTTNNWDKCLASTNGYMSVTGLKAFLEYAYTVPDELLPDLGPDATDADVRKQVAQTSWADPAVSNKITTIEAYTKYQTWIRAFLTANPDFDQQMIVDSPKAYLSSRLSAILPAPVLLKETDEVELAMTGFALGSGNPPNGEVIVELKVGNPPASIQLQAAREAFADIVWLGESLKAIRKAAPSDVDAAVQDGNKVKLTVKMPSSVSGFLKLNIQ